MDEAVIIETVNTVFRDSFEIEDDALVSDAKIFDDLGLDSLDVVDLVVALQQAFNVSIRDDERVRSIRTLGDVYAFIVSLQAEGIAPDA